MIESVEESETSRHVIIECRIDPIIIGSCASKVVHSDSPSFQLKKLTTQPYKPIQVKQSLAQNKKYTGNLRVKLSGLPPKAI